ncbi:MAG: PilT/PilU family type 4a pilus ATPase [Pseudobacteriovorax sp.]|nr:PilT/PilU family type 4a pilus ATPase [Pseudobacteriovorax sp.]
MEPVAGDFVSEQSNSFDTRSELPEDFDKAPLKKPFKIHFGAFQPGESIDSGIDQPINKLLKIMVEKNASDLHLSQTQPIILRIDGNITRLNQEPINEALMEELILPIMPKKNLLEFALNNDTDFSYEIRNLARFRVNVFRNINGVAAVLRQIPNRVLTMEELNLPSAIRSLCNLNKGLVVVTGPTGSGKSTTLAAMIDHINKTRSEHILTIEDPVEFIHQPQSCIINQREVHKHTESFSKALRAALREDPDIVMIGEMRDLETVAIAIETAETGHLVFGTLHTNTAISTVDRLIDQFPADQQEQIRVMLAASLKGVVSQTLIPKIGGGRCAAQEILIVDKAVSSLIRESNTHMIQNHMQTQKSKGNILLNEALFTMVKKGKITAEDAYLKAAEKEAFISLARQKGIVLSTAS